MSRESIDQLNKVKFFTPESAEQRANDLDTISSNLNTISDRIRALYGSLGLEGAAGSAADNALASAANSAAHGSDVVAVIAEARRLAATAGRNAQKTQEEVESQVSASDTGFENANPYDERTGVVDATKANTYDQAKANHEAAIAAANSKAKAALDTLNAETQSAIAKLNTLWPESSDGAGGGGGSSSSSSDGAPGLGSGGGQEAGTASPSRGISPTHSATAWTATGTFRSAVGLPGNAVDGVHLESTTQSILREGGSLTGYAAKPSGFSSPVLSANAAVAGAAGLGGAAAIGVAGTKAYRAAQARTAAAIAGRSGAARVAAPVAKGSLTSGNGGAASGRAQTRVATPAKLTGGASGAARPIASAASKSVARTASVARSVTNAPRTAIPPTERSLTRGGATTAARARVAPGTAAPAGSRAGLAADGRSGTAVRSGSGASGRAAGVTRAGAPAAGRTATSATGKASSATGKASSATAGRGTATAKSTKVSVPRPISGRTESTKASTASAAKPSGAATTKGASPASRPVRSGFLFGRKGKDEKQEQAQKTPRENYAVKEIGPDDRISFIEAGHR